MRRAVSPAATARCLVAALAFAACQDIDDGDPEQVGGGDAGGGRVVDGGGAGGAGGGGGAGGAGGGGGGAGGAGGGGGDAGPPPDPDAAPADCEGAVSVSARLADDRLYRRDEPAEITFTANAAGGPPRMRFAADAGGRFTERADRVFWAGGAGEETDVPWPWWTGPVRVTVTAADARGCSASATVDVTLAGDVVLTDGERPSPMVYGSHGAYLGRLPLVGDGRGLHAATVLPDSEGRGLVVTQWAHDGQPPAFRRLDERGRVVGELEPTDLAGERIFPAGDRPTALAWWPARREVVAAGAAEGRVPRWRADGTFAGEYEVPLDHGGGSHEPVGFGFRGPALAVGRDLNNRVFALHPDDGGATPLFDVGEGFDDLVRLAPGHGGSILAVASRAGVWRIERFDGGGVLDGTAVGVQGVISVVPFVDDYLVLDQNGARVMGRAVSENLGLAPEWDRGHPPDLRTRSGLVWLDGRDPD
jgi:hypothetical protein